MSGVRQRALLVFARLPALGRGKTRLAAGVGRPAALDFYRACSSHTISEAARCDDVTRYLFYANDGSTEEDVAKWMEEIGHSGSFIPRPQEGEDLGRCMMGAFEEVFHNGAVQAVIIGTDCPDLNAHIIMKAFAALSHNEVVFGPARDGGYYLLGLTRTHTTLFEKIPWSTSEVLHLSAIGALQAQLQVAPLSTLPPLVDVDTVEDLQSWLHMPGFMMRRSSTHSRNLARLLSWNSGGAAGGDGLAAMANNGGDLKKVNNMWQVVRRVAESILEEKRLMDDALAETGYLL